MYYSLINTCITVSLFHAQSVDYLSSLPIQITATPLIHILFSMETWLFIIYTGSVLLSLIIM
jgi:hypothetical protein